MKTIHTILCFIALVALGPDTTPSSSQGQDHGHGSAQHEDREPNHLAGETSPYLRQHMYNPVDWYPWGEEALKKAREENKPIFLSIGYSACHWCHVMERESFENERIAALMNRWFVNIKVDREERPDIDEVYMGAVVKMTGSGGWPMSVFMTPDLEPFFGGTYFPPRAGRGRPGFDQVLEQMHTIWETDRETAVEQGRNMVRLLNQEHAPHKGGEIQAQRIFERSLQLAERRYDPKQGGFGNPPRFAPKFPHCTELVYLLRLGARTGKEHALQVVEHTLRKMARGGIYDQIAGGFARYSVDASWTVPHFEKMLYDNAQLAQLYTEAWQATRDPLFERISREILDYVLREMTGPEGGFYSTTDADSEGHEGKFFVWSRPEFDAVCAEHADLAREWFGVTDAGNFEGKNILTAHRDLKQVAQRFELEEEEAWRIIQACKSKLYERREERVHPLLDDKMLTSWNGLMLSAFARAAQVHRHQPYLAAAQRNANFLLQAMRREDGGLHRTRRAGDSRLAGTLEDYAFVSAGLLDLYEADLDPRWLAAAQETHAWVEEHFKDEGGGGYYSFSDKHEKLPVRTASALESSLPSDIGVAALNAVRLGLLAGDTSLIERGHAVLERYAAELERYPNGSSQLLILLDFLESRPQEVYVVGPAEHPAVARRLADLRSAWPPYRVFTRVDPGGNAALVRLLPATEGKDLVDGQPAAFVCFEGVCAAPEVLTPEVPNPEVPNVEDSTPDAPR